MPQTLQINGNVIFQHIEAYKPESILKRRINFSPRVKATEPQTFRAAKPGVAGMSQRSERESYRQIQQFSVE